MLIDGVEIVKKGPPPVNFEDDCSDLAIFAEAATSYVEHYIMASLREMEIRWKFSRVVRAPYAPISRIVRLEKLISAHSFGPGKNYSMGRVTIPCGLESFDSNWRIDLPDYCGKYRLTYVTRPITDELALTGVRMVAEAMQAGERFDHAHKVLAPIRASHIRTVQSVFGGSAIRQGVYG